MSIAQFRNILPLFIGVALLNIGHGLQSSLVSIISTKADFGASITGIIMSGYSIGLLLSALLTPRIVAKVGHVRVFAAFASVVSTAILVMPIWIDPFAWFFLRIITGVCMAGLAIVVESWLNSASDNSTRGSILSVYMLIVYSALGSGQFLLNVVDVSGFVRFIMVSALVSLALVPISLTPGEQPSIENPKPVSLAKIFHTSPLAFIGLFTAGLGQSAFFAMGALFGLMQGLSIGLISTMMALPMLGVILSQYPVGWLSDRFDRRKVLVAVAIATTMAAVAMLGASEYSVPIVTIGLFALFGALAFPLYSLGLAHANDQLEYDEMLGASSKLVLIYALGSIAGPLLAGGCMQAMGAMGFIIFMISIHGIFAIYGIYRVIVTVQASSDTSEFYLQVVPGATPVGAAAYAEEFHAAVEKAEEEAEEETNS